MPFGAGSPKSWMAVRTIAVLVVVLAANAAWLILTKRAELRRDIVDRATTFALLTRQPICEGYETYYASGLYKYRELMKGYLKLEPDVERILIVSVNGEILVDSAELEDASPHRDGGAPRLVTDPGRLDAVKKLEPSRLAALDSTGAPALEIVAPYIEDWGRHKLSVLYRVHYRNLRPNTDHFAYAVLGLALISTLVAALVLAAWSRSAAVEAAS